MNDSTSGPIHLFVSLFPVLAEPSREFVAEWGPDAGLYVWLDLLFDLVIFPLLDASATDDAGLRRLFGAIETLATDERPEVEAFVGDGILEVIGDSDRRLTRAWGYMGPGTRALTLEVERRLGRKHPGLPS